jgi:DNA-directed RNA polymerase specialized sigma24 family protein
MKIPATDDCHDAFVELASKHGCENVEFPALLKRARFRRCDRFRQSARFPSGLETVIESREAATTTENEVLSRERADVVEAELTRLRPCHAMAVRRCDFDGESPRDVSREMGIPEGTLKCWRQRGRDQLRRSPLLAALFGRLGSRVAVDE